MYVLPTVEDKTLNLVNGNISRFQREGSFAVYRIHAFQVCCRNLCPLLACGKYVVFTLKYQQLQISETQAKALPHIYS